MVQHWKCCVRLVRTEGSNPSLSVFSFSLRIELFVYECIFSNQNKIYIYGGDIARRQTVISSMCLSTVNLYRNKVSMNTDPIKTYNTATSQEKIVILLVALLIWNVELILQVVRISYWNSEQSC
jgi:hypothetical protein